MRLLITRPVEDAAPLVKLLKAQGHSCVEFPLLSIVPDVEGAKSLSDYKVKDIQALIMTSANGVRAFANADARRSFKIMAVGDATAKAARDAGFKSVETASGDVDTLAALIKEKGDPTKGPFLHVAGSRLAGDLKGLLEKDGFAYERVVLYHADKTERFSLALEKEIRMGEIDGVLLYSPRTGAAFVELLEKSGLKNNAKNMLAYGLSAAVASKIKDIAWKDIIIAATPDQDALLASIQKTKDETMTIPKNEEAPKMDSKPSETKPDPKVVDTKVNTVKEDAAKKPAPSPDKKSEVKTPNDPVEKALKTKVENDAPKKGSFKTKLLLAGIVIVAAAGAGSYFTKDIWLPKAKAKIVDVLGLETAVASSDPRLDDLVARLDTLEKAKPSQAVDLKPVMAQVEALDKALNDVKTDISTISVANGNEGKLEEFKALALRLESATQAGGQDLSALRDENARLSQLVTELNSRLTDIEAARLMQRGASDNAQALVAALSSLREVVRTSASYEIELQALAALAQGDVVLEQAVETLQGDAAKGVPSLSALTANFDGVANDIVRAIAIPESAGWVEKTVQNITSLIKIRRAPGQTTGEGPLGIVARAEMNLQAGDLAGALKELETLDAKPLEAAKPWIDAGKARMNTDQTLSLMQAHILSLLGRTGGQG
jgi:uroporphyrinogen-III synthase